MTFSIRCIPGFAALNGRQRETLLDLCERGELQEPISVGRRRGNAPILVVDRTGERRLLHTDGRSS